MTSQDSETSSLTGVWHGLYSYPARYRVPETPFTCVLIDNGGRLSGTIHEKMLRYKADPVDTNAWVEGVVTGDDVTFLKTYDGGNGQSHSVSYQGQLSGDRNEVEGTWSIHQDTEVFSGRFLMIRKRGEGAAQSVEMAEHVV